MSSLEWDDQWKADYALWRLSPSPFKASGSLPMVWSWSSKGCPLRLPPCQTLTLTILRNLNLPCSTMISSWAFQDTAIMIDNPSSAVSPHWAWKGFAWFTQHACLCRRNTVSLETFSHWRWNQLYQDCQIAEHSKRLHWSSHGSFILKNTVWMLLSRMGMCWLGIRFRVDIGPLKHSACGFQCSFWQVWYRTLTMGVGRLTKRSVTLYKQCLAWACSHLCCSVWQLLTVLILN